MKTVIVHSDINHCYAQIEEMMNPSLRHIPMAVGGSEEKRSGIILAKNDLAKKYKVRTGESLREALHKCPDLKIVHPNYDAYVYYTNKVKAIYAKYTDKVESFGLDEAWIDLTASQRLFGDGYELAKKIQDEVYQETGLTVSMGVSFNKVFAKLGSDIFKHKGYALITPENYKEIVWPLDVGDLIMVGRHTEYKLERMGIYTIGDLAATPNYILEKTFGKMGILLWTYANGLDNSPVHEIGYKEPVKSIGNSKTLVKDVCNKEQLFEVLFVLAETVAARCRREELRGQLISVCLRGSDLRYKARQRKLKQPTDIALEIANLSMQLAEEILGNDSISLRSVGINMSDLHKNCHFEQPSLFEDPNARKKQRDLEDVLVKIRSKYGYQSCRPLGMKLDKEITDFDPLSVLHEIHPVGFLNGPILP